MFDIQNINAVYALCRTRFYPSTPLQLPMQENTNESGAATSIALMIHFLHKYSHKPPKPQPAPYKPAFAAGGLQKSSLPAFPSLFAVFQSVFRHCAPRANKGADFTSNLDFSVPQRRRAGGYDIFDTVLTEFGR
ncbi:hypothetical protein [Neisseria lactamica]|uniref:hypothetical protein n=1 Tax=Neisseria lactamica TaxID=486 RepID=UPI0001972BD3|nr:hypothetical protein [Neisseria lactamica]